MDLREIIENSDFELIDIIENTIVYHATYKDVIGKIKEEGFKGTVVNSEFLIESQSPEVIELENKITGVEVGYGSLGIEDAEIWKKTLSIWGEMDIIKIKIKKAYIIYANDVVNEQVIFDVADIEEY